MSRRRRSKFVAGLAIAACLAMAPIVAAATSGTYAGLTSQHLKITFRIAHNGVSAIKVRVIDRCRVIDVDDSIQPGGRYSLRIGSHGGFGGTFTSNRGPTHIAGTVRGTRVTGTITDTYKYSANDVCHGKVSFSARKR
jgi:hypothetical protein